MHLYTITIQLPTNRVRHILHWSSWIRGEHQMKHFVDMMEWFKPLNTWYEILSKELAQCQPDPGAHFLETHMVIIFRRTWSRQGRWVDHIRHPQYLPSNQFCFVYRSYGCSVLDCEVLYRELQRDLCEYNHTIPKEIWPTAFQVEVLWDFFLS